MLLALHICPALTMAGACSAVGPVVRTGGGQYDEQWLHDLARRKGLAAIQAQQQAALGLYAAGRIDRRTLLALLRDVKH